MLVDITCTINGRERNLAVEATELLVDTLRLRLGLTGTKKACGTGDCGACTVIVDGEAVRSCILLTASMHGKSITTIEGLGDVSHLHPIQQAFIDAGAVQCGNRIPRRNRFVRPFPEICAVAPDMSRLRPPSGWRRSEAVRPVSPVRRFAA